MAAQFDLPPWIEALTIEYAVKLLLFGLYGSTAPAGATPIPTTGGGSSTVTPHTVLLGAIASQVVPAGAKGWTVSVITGTATINGAAGMPAGFSDSDTNTLAAPFTVTTAGASSAYIRYNS